MANTVVSRSLAESGYVLLSPDQLQQQLSLSTHELDALREAWSRLPADAWLRDGGHYRYRRHSCFVHQIAGNAIEQVPHRAHWQPTDFNALHGGMER